MEENLLNPECWVMDQPLQRVVVIVELEVQNLISHRSFLLLEYVGRGYRQQNCRTIRLDGVIYEPMDPEMLPARNPGM
jgi:hypothetical protein